ncbi:hypothetical protein MB27_29585 [Actinoplanes utahensis]|uniref:Uncharacterized protein n=1 Tax=Actinoplanes utahensis TaxID=1869 RepID=A0A0A6X2F9_ACTUT|nr:hypothetical protein MB27_29585 [Actinoplanes utahensis]
MSIVLDIAEHAHGTRVAGCVSEQVDECSIRSAAVSDGGAEFIPFYRQETVELADRELICPPQGLPLLTAQTSDQVRQYHPRTDRMEGQRGFDRPFPAPAPQDQAAAPLTGPEIATVEESGTHPLREGGAVHGFRADERQEPVRSYQGR